MLVMISIVTLHVNAKKDAKAIIHHNCVKRRLEEVLNFLFVLFKLELKCKILNRGLDDKIKLNVLLKLSKNASIIFHFNFRYLSKLNVIFKFFVAFHSVALNLSWN